MMAGIKDRRIITYGSAANADVRAVNVRSEGGSMVFDVQLSDRICDGLDRMSDVRLPMLGDHNAQNCLAAIAVALEMNVAPERIIETLAKFGGVGRRFDKKGVEPGRHRDR